MVDQNSENIDPIQNAFSQVRRKAPELAWNDIEQNLSLDNDEHSIGKAFNSLDRTAPLYSWQGVKRQLIIDEVWLNIASRLNERKRRFFWFYLSGFAALLILGTIAGLTFSSENHISTIRNSKEIFLSGKYQQVATQKSVAVNQVPVSGNENRIQNRTDESLTEKISLPQEKGNDLADENTSQDETTMLVQQNQTLTDPEFQSGNSNKSEFCDPFPEVILSELPQSPICILPFNQSVSFPIVPIEKDERVFNRFEVGLIAGLNNTWIFNNDVKEGLSRFSLVDNKFSIGYSTGLNFVFNFFKSHAVEMQFDFISKMNQHYSYFDDGNIFTRQISISQQKYSLSYKYSSQNIFSKNQFIILKGGMFFSNSFKSEFYSNKELFTEQVIGNYDFGFKAGIGLQRRFGDLVLEYGIQSDIGLINIATSPSYNSKKFNYTTTYLTGLYFSLRYSF